MSVDVPEFCVRVALGEINQRVVVSGELDLVTAPRLEECLNGFIDSTDSDVVVDLAGVTFIDSTGLRVLLVAHDRLAQSNRTLAIGGPSVQVVRLLEICGLCHIIESDPSSDGETAPRSDPPANTIAVGDGDVASDGPPTSALISPAAVG